MNARYTLLETARQLRNTRSLVFTFVLPVGMLLLFGAAYGTSGAKDPVTHLPWLVVTTVQMAAYGAMMAGLSQAMGIVQERSIGWNRQLRVTPLSGVGYLASKIAGALAVAAIAVTLVLTVSIAVLHAHLAPVLWLTAAVGLWIGIVPFALIAILIGQYARPEFAQPLFMITFMGLSMLGGLWVPLSVLPAWVSGVAEAVPSYWLDRLGEMGAGMTGDMTTPMLVLAVWTAALGVLIVWRYRHDAARA